LIRHAETGKIIDELQYDDMAICLEVFQDNKSFVALGEETIRAYDMLTRQVLFEIDKVPASWS
jgi:hypothetical protein